MPPADRPIVTALRLPRKYAITSEPVGDDDAFLAKLQLVADNGIRLLQLRAKKLPALRLKALAAAASVLSRERGATLLLNGNVELVRELDLDGVHLPAADLMRLDARPLGPDRWVAASCHDERELAHAAAIDVDFAVLGPVLPTRSHSGAAAIGWERFAELCATAPFPVYALGGMLPRDLPKAIATGAQGIAGISAFWTEHRAGHDA
jgi:8-oxo-dGTP diphosphatase